MDERREALQRWLASVLDQPFEISVASADASFRRYFRVHLGGHTRIAMDAPPELEDSRPFIDVAGRLRAAGLNAPEILASDLAQGFLLLTDLGTQTLLEAMTADNADSYMAAAIKVLVRMQRNADAAGLPDYDVALLQRELSLYPQWYLGRHAGITLSRTEQGVWDAACSRLVDEAISQPQVFVHRDFMPRNLMTPMKEGDAPGVIDFQDAVCGPVTYDLVSLFRDAFASWPEADIARWREQYRRQAEDAGIDLPENLERSMDWMGIQRHIKVIGIFARLNYRDGKPEYLAETPRFHRHVYEIGAKYEDFMPLLELMRRYEVRGAR